MPIPCPSQDIFLLKSKKKEKDSEKIIKGISKISKFS
jgi:hypothetical protein